MLKIKELLTRYQHHQLGQKLQLILAWAINQSKEFVYAHPEYRPKPKEYLRFRYGIWRSKKGYPLAYITNQREFYGLNFYVNKYVLIPRPETEMMVEAAAKILNNSTNTYEKTLMIDVGTGSGCIPIAILKNLDIARRNLVDIIAVDVSPQALKVARLNANQNRVDINFVYSNLLDEVGQLYGLQSVNYQQVIITANLPYLTAQQYQSEPSIKFEPKKALVAKDGGLDLYNRLLKQIDKIKKPPTINWHIFLEIDPRQAKKITSLLKTSLRYSTLEIKTDLAGHKRLACISILQS